jgi:hypothetical protein
MREDLSLPVFSREGSRLLPHVCHRELDPHEAVLLRGMLIREYIRRLSRMGLTAEDSTSAVPKRKAPEGARKRGVEAQGKWRDEPPLATPMDEFSE